jgi:hypothetical protein
VFHFDGRSFAKVISDTPKSYEVLNECPENVSNLNDVASRGQIVMGKFLLQVDKSLRILLNAYRLPLFVTGPGRLVGHFMKLTKNREAIANVIYHDDQVTFRTLPHILAPSVDEWNEMLNEYRLNKTGIAAKKNRLAVGVTEVLAAAKENNVDQLIVEQDFRGANGGADKVFPIRTSMYDKHSGPMDVVDDIIGEALKHGADVSFVENNTLDAYGHIVAIKRF